jgi:2-iminobutanoate/2-iminopropanoate deaminase
VARVRERTVELINPAACPPQNPSYSQAAVSGGMVYLAGQIGIVPETGKLVSGDVGEQTARLFENARLVLEAAGSSLEKVVRVTVFMVDLAEWPAMNAAYERAFRGHAPPKSTVEVKGLALGARVEIDFIAER